MRMSHLVFFFVFLFFLNFSLRSEIIRYDVTNAKYEKYSPTEICQELGYKHLLLTEVRSGNLDCMGNKISLNDICKKKLY